MTDIIYCPACKGDTQKLMPLLYRCLDCKKVHGIYSEDELQELELQSTQKLSPKAFEELNKMTNEFLEKQGHK